MADALVPYLRRSDEEVLEIYREFRERAQSDEHPGLPIVVPLLSISREGVLSVDVTPQEAGSVLLQAFGELRGNQDFSSRIILTNTLEVVTHFNTQVQDMLAGAGELSKHRLKFGQDYVHVGDRVIFDHENAALGIKENAIGVVRSIDLLRRKASVLLDTREEVFFSVRDHVSLHLAYALPLDRVPDRTFEHTFVYLTGPTVWYDMAALFDSPHRETADIFTDRRSLESAPQLPVSALQSAPRQPYDLLGYLFDLDREQQQGNVRVCSTLIDAQQALVTAWWQTAAHHLASSLMIAQTRALAEQLSSRAQELRAGELSHTAQLQVGTQVINEGDRVMFTADTDQYRKGDVATVRLITPESQQVLVEFDSDDRRAFSLAGKEHDIQLAYALTPQDMENRPVAHAYFLVTHSLEHQYAQPLAEAQQAWATDQSRLCPASDRTTFFFDRETGLPELAMMQAVRYGAFEAALKREKAKFLRAVDAVHTQSERYSAVLEQKIEQEAEQRDYKLGLK